MIGFIDTAPIIFTGGARNTAQEIRHALLTGRLNLITRVIADIQHFAQAADILAERLLDSFLGDPALIDGSLKLFKQLGFAVAQLGIDITGRVVQQPLQTGPC